MKKFALIVGSLLVATVAIAAVTVTVAPQSLVTNPTTVSDSSDDLALFSFTLTGTDSETLESVSVTVENSGSSTADSGDLDSVSVFADDGDGDFDSGDDSAGNESTVNVGSSTVVDTTTNNDLTGGQKYFVTIQTSATWGDDNDDLITVTLDEDGIVTSADSPDVDDVTTDTIGVNDDEDEDEDCDEQDENNNDDEEAEDNDEEEDNDEDEDEDNDDSDECDDNNDEIGNCTNGLRNGRIYKLEGAENQTVYLAAACRLKPFRGAAAFHARGHKFQNIIILDSLDGYDVSDKPALPAGGTIIKGSDNTVWIITKPGKRKGFVSANAFARLGFHFGQVQQITDSDLSTIETDSPVTENDSHPEGTVAKCGNSPIVFEIKGNRRLPFVSAEAFELRGHSWHHVALINCERFAYLLGENQTEND